MFSFLRFERYFIGFGTKFYIGQDILGIHLYQKMAIWAHSAAALHIDAFSRDWNDWESIYLFPPFHCLHRVVSLVRIYKGKGFLIAPYWPSAPWFVTLKLRCPLRRPLRLGHYLFQYTSQGLVHYHRISCLKLTVWMLQPLALGQRVGVTAPQRQLWLNIRPLPVTSIRLFGGYSSPF